ncbi:MAG: hypothetical protein DCF25_08190 [Leptolyngbya foveolarum]|uniref:Cytoskeleton protein RodZ-like C-terminal domain-containing protein n=1 Tax=Leptolyngbya foveolarum TaxID=47253 RepID=A0A2W4UGF5_9CYAN|nr:MAG: hypothetical protein DCF25_08190 [Leptolyngbya foveolarum]
MTKFSAQQQSQLAQIGVFLRENREKQSKSLEDIAIRTYIRPQLLNGIESGDPDLLPEPIFVQGFIRRYAENLGLDGKDLSTQFSVDSIPSTPRPTRQAEPEDSPTTRLTRGASAAKATSTDSSAVKAAMFSAGSASPLEDSLGLPKKTTLDQSPAAAEIPLIVDDAVLDMSLEGTEGPVDSTFETSGFSFSQTDIQTDIRADALKPDALKPDVLKTDVKEDSDNEFQQLLDEASASSTNSAGPDSFNGRGAETKLPTTDLPTADLPNSEDTFASKVAEFDRQNLTPPVEPKPPAELTAASASTNRFDDDLPTELTTASDASATPVYTNPKPVEVEYDRPEGPNLKPFVIGGFVAVLLTAAVVALASLFGGDRTPAVADNPAPIEQTSGDLETVGKETLPPIPAKTASPPASTAPVYVEAKATAEAWVSVIADGTTVFEGTLQPGDTAVWEGQEIVNVYAGDAGALEIAQNGKPAAVMGERGQPEEKTFTLN